MSAARACVVNLGCKVNRIESDDIERSLHEFGCELVDEADAQLVVVNTCAVTGEAQAKTRQAVRRAAWLPQRPLVCVTGCVANLFPEELAKLGERVVVVTDKQAVAATALASLASEGPAAGECPQAPAVPAAAPIPETLAPEAPEPPAPTVAHGHEAPTYETRLRRGVKVQDGCDNRCTYCIVWRARGASRSVALPQIEGQVRQLLAEGACEIVLSGINLGRYLWHDPNRPEDGPLTLDGLLRRVAHITGERALVRISSVEPPEVTPALAQAMAELRGHVCPHLHLPLQSGCDATLARMGRTYDTAGFARVVATVRAALPELSLSTDVIVGFPGETEEEFEQTLAFCRQMRFSKMHVFRFSARPDTPAASMPDPVDPRVAHERSVRLRALADELRAQDARSRVGTVEPVLVERTGPDGSARGTTASYHRVRLEPAAPASPSPAPGLTHDARLVTYDERTHLLLAQPL